MPVREPAGAARWTLGRWADQSQDGRLPVAEAGACGADRVSRMDQRKPLAALEVRGLARGQEAEGRPPRMTHARAVRREAEFVTRSLHAAVPRSGGSQELPSLPSTARLARDGRSSADGRNVASAARG